MALTNIWDGVVPVLKIAISYCGILAERDAFVGMGK
jgi:hypothetical protein